MQPNYKQSFLIAVPIVGAMFLFAYLGSPPVEKKEFTACNTDELRQRFDLNSLAAADIGWVRVTGTVDDVGETMLGKPFVTLDGNIRCFLVDARFAKRVLKGQSVVVSGKVTGELGSIVRLSDCTLEWRPDNL